MLRHDETFHLLLHSQSPDAVGRILKAHRVAGVEVCVLARTLSQREVPF